MCRVRYRSNLTTDHHMQRTCGHSVMLITVSKASLISNEGAWENGFKQPGLDACIAQIRILSRYIPNQCSVPRRAS